MRAGRWLAIAVWCLCTNAAGATFSGRVTHVTDGDTLWVRPPGGGPARAVRLDGIDAPEACQPHGVEARAALSEQVLGRTVRVTGRREDGYGRMVARISLHGADVGGWLVRQGHAWSPGWRQHDGPYAAEQREARQARRGLWAVAAPMAPQVFRRFHGSCTPSGS